MTSSSLDQLALRVGDLRERTQRAVEQVVVGLGDATDQLLMALIAGLLIGTLLGEVNLPFAVMGLCVVFLLWLIITVVAVIVTSELAWRRLTVAQSSMYLRTTQVLLLYADLRMIVKRRLSFLRRKKPAPTTASAISKPEK